MTTIEQQGKTVDDAISKALEQLQVNREQISVEILEEGSRGFLGLMGGKPATIRVSVNQDTTDDTLKGELRSVPNDDDAQRQEKRPAQKEDTSKKDTSKKDTSAPKQYDEEDVQQIVANAKQALSVILQNLQVEYTVEVKRREDQILLNIHCDNENFLIGRRGTTLDAVQYLVNRIANKNAQEKIQVVLDTSNYRVNRKQRLEKLALRLSRRVKMTGKSVTVAPMNPHDRRIIHLTLQDDSAIRTLSRGSGFMRRIVISSNRNSSRSRK